MMPLPVCRKTRTMEKVEIVYRTARARNDSIDTSRPHWITLARRSRDWQPDW
jgi:hypothetical protein